MRRLLLFWGVLLLLGSVGVKGQTLFGGEQVISTDSERPTCVYAVDLDGDGDIDALSASENKIAWYKNDGNGNFSSENVIPTNLYHIWSIYASDLDSDGDMDIIVTSLVINNIAWYENDGSGNFNSETIISTNAPYALSVHTADLDADGDMDVISASNNKVAWYENDGNGNFNSEIIISIFDDKSTSVYTVDLDGDGDMDIISAFIEKIVWYENDGNGNFNSEIIISTATYGTESIHTADLDGDNDIDVISASTFGATVYWHKNDGNENFIEQNIISTNITSAWDVYGIDLDNDADIDVISAFDNKIAWFENDGNGNFSSEIIISSNADFAISVYALDFDSDNDIDIISASVDDNKIAWYENLSNFTNITNFTFQDSNENGFYDNNENPLSNQQLLLQPTAAAQFTNIEGNTSFFVENDEYQLSSQPNTLWELTTIPESYNITVTDTSELPIYYFGFKPTRLIQRTEPRLNSSPTRCNTTANYWLHYSNTGTTIANGTITLETDELMGFISSNPEPNSIEGNTLTWYFSELHPSYENKISLQFQMPDFNSMGEILETQATVQLFNENQELTYTKTTDYNSELLCSYDPNDKLARSNILGQSEFAYIADTIQYTIRFQNTGNDTAFNIRIEDFLDKKLDWTTFHPITASHDYRTELNRETGLATFYFDDILLPDSTTNEAESHGFVMFGIASLEGIEDKTKVENTASIFFDFNPPIITNTAVLTLLQQVETDIEVLENGASIRVYPNPFSDFTTIEVNGLPQGNYQLQVMDILGRKVRELKLENFSQNLGKGKVRLERGKLEAGMYFFRLLEKGNLEIIRGGKVFID
ncbi:MAG: FG-GAP-like repeat-containing protein [Chitinophagales bacterium]